MVDRKVVRVALIDQHSFRPDHELRFLAVRKRSNGVHDGYLEFPGGGIEPGEDALSALVRETDEELGTRLEHIRYKPIAQGRTSLVEKDEFQHWRLYLGLAPPLDRIELSSELVGYVLLTPAELVAGMDRYPDLSEHANAIERWSGEPYAMYREQILRKA